MIKTIRGDILDAQEKYIVHQCNSTSSQAAGLALQIFAKYPYANIYKNRGGSVFGYKYISAFHTTEESPGNIVIKGDGNKQRFIINLIGQVYPGAPLHDGLRDGYKVREGYFNQCLTKILGIPNIESIALPVGIGCGLAGGNWSNYLPMIEKFDRAVNERQKVNVVLYNKDAK
jgi:O-acetyl-ADP-ribose deacetylase (regulator of RNase III)